MIASMEMDWTKIVADLKQSGLSQAQMASAVPCAQSVISDLARGITTKPRWPVASTLLALHKKRMRVLARRQAEESKAGA